MGCGGNGSMCPSLDAQGCDADAHQNRADAHQHHGDAHQDLSGRHGIGHGGADIDAVEVAPDLLVLRRRQDLVEGDPAEAAQTLADRLLAEKVI